jgi:hypothetical protein
MCAGCYRNIAIRDSLEIQLAVVDAADFSFGKQSSFKNVVHDMCVVDSLDLRDERDNQSKTALEEAQEVAE